MKAIRHADSVRFTTKGRVVIPARLRKEFHIENGTRAIVQSTPEGILVKPVTRHAVSLLHGSIKRKPDEKPLAEEWAAHKDAELAREEARHARRAGGSR